MTSIKTCISIFATFLVLAATMTAPAGAVSKAEKIAFTNAEKEWLAAHRKIVFGGEMDWAPFDFMNLVAKKTGLEIRYITGPTWDEFLSMMKSGDLDVMINIVRTPEREKYLLYTQPFAANPNSILSRKEEPFDKLEDLFGKSARS